MLKRIIRSLIMTFLLIGLYQITSSAALSVNSASVESEETVTISVNSDVAVKSYKVSVTSNSGLTFISSSGGTGSGTTTITNATAGSGITNLATFVFKAPNVENITTYKVTFSATAMENSNFEAVSDSNATSTITVKPKNVITTPPEVNNPETPSTPTTNNQTPTNPTTNPTPQKSSNANLSNLGIRPNDFSGFRQGTTTYNVTVPNDVESVEVYATKADSKATVAGTGTKTLQEGANTLTVTVTAEDGTKKTYTINVTREAVTENEDENTTDENTVPEEPIQENQEAIGDGLSELTINNVKLTPSFETGVYEYTAKYIGESTELEIEATPTDETYIVDITGNEDLQEGENTITILVSDAEGNNVATYQITVNKSLVDEEAIAREQEEKENQQRMIIIGVVIAVVVIVIIIFIIIRHRRNKQWAEEYSGVPFAGLNSEDEDIDNSDSEQYDEQENYSNQPYFQDDYATEENIEDDDDEWPKKKHGRGKRFK